MSGEAYKRIVDYDNGNCYVSHEFLNASKSTIESHRKKLAISGWFVCSLYMHLYKLFSRKYFHYSIQNNQLILYMRLIQLPTRYLLLGININRIGLVSKVKLYIYRLKTTSFTAFALSLKKPFVKFISSKIIYRSNNLTIVYRDVNNIYLCFRNDIIELSKDMNVVCRLISAVHKNEPIDYERLARSIP